MSAGQPLTTKFYPQTIIAIVVAFSLFSCKLPVFVKNYPKGKPFVFETNIQLNGKFSIDTSAFLKSKLRGQLDDSMKSRSVSKVLWSVMKNPPVYDSVNADKSILYMRALLVSQGFFRDSITYKAKIDSGRGDQYRTTVTFDVTPGKQVKIDSFAYNIKNDDLQKLALENQPDAKVKKGDPFAKTNISLELDRLVELYRNNGYLKFGREDLYGLWDTLDISLLNPNLDPFEQLELLQKIRERQENPKANLEIRLRPTVDSSKLRKYYISSVTVYPDFTLDTTLYQKKETYVNGIKVISYRNLFKPQILPQNIYLNRGDMYDQRNYFRTINRFNSIGAWRLTNIEQKAREGQDSADITIRLTPARKYTFSTNFESSRNQTAFSGNLLGVAINLGLQNRNFAKAANQATTNIRFGIETGRDTATKVGFLQTRQVSASHTIVFPRAILINKLISPKYRNNVRTVFAVNGSITERRLLYDLNSINGSWGYDIQLGKWPVTIKFPNIEYSKLDAKPKLDTIFKYNPSLRRVFNDGLITSVIVGASTSGGKGNRTSNLKLNGELSGFPGIIRNKFFDSNLYRFAKVDAEFAQKISLGKTDLVFRFFAGVGYAFNSTVNIDNRFNLPFFRQYFAGGPNSMRAWGLRKLGPGSTLKDFSITGQPDRYGDMQLETNLEYRFPIANIAGVKLNGAFFTDIGNIWYVKNNGIAADSNAIFHLKNLPRDIAVGSGIGLRFDFDFFVIRLDFAHKVKDPTPPSDKQHLQNKWFGYANKQEFFNGTRFQLGISYPFIL